MARRALCQQRVQQQPGKVCGGQQRLRRNPRLAVDAKAQRDLTRRHAEQGRGLPRQGAAVKGQPERHRPPVRPAGHIHHRIKAQARLSCRPGDLEHQQITRHAAPLARLGRRGACHIIRHRKEARIHTLGPQTLRRRAEIQHVACVIAKAKDDAATQIRRPRHRGHRAGRRRGEHIPRHGPIRQPRADITQKGRIMPRPAAHNQRHLARCAGMGAQRPMRDGHHTIGIGGAKPGKGRGGKIFGLIHDLCHDRLPLCARTRRM